MGDSPHQTVGPVILTQGYLFPWSEFQTAVSPEMTHGIGTETVARIQIGRNLIVRGRGMSPVYHLEIILSASGCR